jgi:glycerol-3-phosphate O-acyltransferase
LRNPSRLLSLEILATKVLVEGDTDALRSLAERGTLVFMPTHSSNLDSIVFGYALEKSQLPPATYGAGKNLFTNPLLSFFMHNLGAYKVDRRLRHALYKDVLKAYSTVLLEEGYHSLFFPGGTRSRSGAVEQRLKLGLMGTGVEAYTRNLMRDRDRKVFFVPATINYLIVLEAETLISDFLSEAGKARYIIEDDESTRLGRVTTFVRKLLAMDGSVVIRFGSPLDPFGNVVDAEGRSHDRRGRVVDAAGYVKNLDGQVCLDVARDAQYTRELGREVVEAYRRESVIMSTNIVASACFEHLRRKAPSGDLFTVLRLRDEVISRDDLAREVLRMRDQLLDLEKSGEVHVAASVRGCSGGDILSQAMRAFRGYHTMPVIEPHPDGVGLCDPSLLFYYQNRMVAHGLGWNPHVSIADGARLPEIRSVAP